jgi:hypothetical protein
VTTAPSFKWVAFNVWPWPYVMHLKRDPEADIGATYDPRVAWANCVRRAKAAGQAMGLEWAAYQGDSCDVSVSFSGKGDRYVGADRLPALRREAGRLGRIINVILCAATRYDQGRLMRFDPRWPGEPVRRAVMLDSYFHLRRKVVGATQHWSAVESGGTTFFGPWPGTLDVPFYPERWRRRARGGA